MICAINHICAHVENVTYVKYIKFGWEPVL